MPPTIICPASSTYEAPYEGYMVVHYESPSVDNNREGATVVRTQGLASGALFPLGLTIISFTATDDYKNTAQCEFTVSIRDTIPRTITCPEDMQIELLPDSSTSVVVGYIPPIGADNRPNSLTKMLSGRRPGERFLFGKTHVLYAVMDEEGNKASCTFTITVVDTLPPAVNCPSNIQVGVSPNQESAIVNYQVSAIDNRDLVEALVEDEHLRSGSNFSIGKHTIRVRATDRSGNMASCAFEITVSASLPPLPETPQSSDGSMVSGDSLSSVKTMMVCENMKGYFHCPTGASVVIESGVYGRTAIWSSHSDVEGYGGCGRAGRRRNECAVDVKERIQDQCGGRSSCLFEVSNNAFDLSPLDPCPGVYKYLNVSYWCSRNEQL